MPKKKFVAILTTAATVAMTTGAAFVPVAGLAQASLTDDLVSCWSMDEASGTRVDVFGDNDLSDSSGVGSATGKIGNAADFDNSTYRSQKVLSGTGASALDMSQGLTVSYWKKSAGYPDGSDWGDILIGSSFGNTGGALYVGDTGSLVNRYFAGAASDMTQYPPDPAFNAFGQGSNGDWQHVVAWYDPADFKTHVEVDGIPEDSGFGNLASHPVFTSDNITIGRDWYGYSFGLIDEVGLWNRVLSPAERAALYNSGAGMACPTPQPPGPPVCGDELAQSAYHFAKDMVYNDVVSAPLFDSLIVLKNSKLVWLDPSLQTVLREENISGNPVAVALDSGANIYTVENSGTNRIVKKYDPTFTTELFSSVLVGGSGPGQIGNAIDIQVDSVGNIYVLDLADHRVVQLDTTGDYVTEWGGFGSGPGQMSGPFSMTIDSSDVVYVADRGNNRIQVFSSDGTFIREWGSAGSGEGQFDGPRAVVVDSSGSVYVADYGNYRIQKFTNAGAFIAEWGSFGEGEGLNDGTRVLALDSATSHLYMADEGDDWPATIRKYDGALCAAPTPPLQQCALDALDALGVAPGTYPEMDAALDALCEDGNEEGDGLTILTDPYPKNYKYTCPESLVLAVGTSIGQNSIGSNDCSNSLFLGSGSTVNGNVLKTEDVWVSGTGNTITGNVNHEVSVHVGPGADLTVGGHINDLQTLMIGSGGTLNAGKNVDIWVDLDSQGTLSVGDTLECNGLTAAPTAEGVVTAGTNNCSYINASIARSFQLGTWAYATLAAVLGFGFALVLEERGKKTKK